jgi:hypothetical protein
VSVDHRYEQEQEADKRWTAPLWPSITTLVVDSINVTIHSQQSQCGHWQMNEQNRHHQHDHWYNRKTRRTNSANKAISMIRMKTCYKSQECMKDVVETTGVPLAPGENEALLEQSLKKMKRCDLAPHCEKSKDATRVLLPLRFTTLQMNRGMPA